MLAGRDEGTKTRIKLVKGVLGKAERYSPMSMWPIWGGR